MSPGTHGNMVFFGWWGFAHMDVWSDLGITLVLIHESGIYRCFNLEGWCRLLSTSRKIFSSSQGNLLTVEPTYISCPNSVWSYRRSPLYLCGLWSRCLTVVILLPMEASRTACPTFLPISNFLIGYGNLVYKSHHWYRHSPLHRHPLFSRWFIQSPCSTVVVLLPMAFYLWKPLILSVDPTAIMPNHINFVVIGYRQKVYRRYQNP